MRSVWITLLPCLLQASLPSTLQAQLVCHNTFQRSAGPSRGWTPQEEWVWSRIIVGEEADFNTRYNTDLDSEVYQPQWRDDPCHPRILRPEFIHDLLTSADLRASIPSRGLRIKGAAFTQPFELRNLQFDLPLWIDDSRFLSEVDLQQSHFSRDVSFEGSHFYTNLFLQKARFSILNLNRARVFGAIDLTQALVGEFLSLRNVSIARGLTMDAATIDGIVEIRDSSISDKTSMRGMAASKTIWIEGTHFIGPFIMTNAVLGRELQINRSIFSHYVSMDGLISKQTVDLRESVFLNEIYLRNIQSMSLFLYRVTLTCGARMYGMKLDGDLKILDSTLFGFIDLTGLKAEKFFSMEGTVIYKILPRSCMNSSGERSFFFVPEYLGIVRLRGADVGLGVHLVGTHSYLGVDLTDAQIQGEFDLGDGSDLSPFATWGNDSFLALQNARVYSLPSAPSIQKGNSLAGWPRIVEMEGLTYSRLGDFKDLSDSDALDWFTRWLALAQNFSPQPYRQLAEVLKAAGHDEVAKSVLYAQRERERAAALERCGIRASWWQPLEAGVSGRSGACVSFVGLTLLKYSIGYGLGTRFFRLLWWIVGALALGSFILWSNEKGRAQGAGFCIRASVDRFVPFISLDQRYAEFINDNYSRFAVAMLDVIHLLGYILASIFVASLMGLTQGG